MFKRCFDVLCSLFLLFLSLPALLFCAVAIKLDSPGPVLFRQQRMGLDFRRFHLLKLRTMEHRRPGSAFTLGADPRITRSGRWLRKYKLDELPQLWNVVRGDMSLVGPRPVIPSLAHEFRADYKALLKVRPGITDPASLKYCHETEILAQAPDPLLYFKTVVTPEKIQISADYLGQRSLWSDVLLIVRTAWALVPRLNRQHSPESGTDEGAGLNLFGPRRAESTDRALADIGLPEPFAAFDLAACAEEAAEPGD